MRVLNLFPIKIQNIVSFNTTASSKPELINNLVYMFAQSKIKIPNVELYKDELKMFTMFVKDNGTVKFSAPAGYYDDIVISLAICVRCVNKYKYSGVNFT